MQYRICKKYISPLFLIPLFICCINAKEYSLSSDWPDSPKKKCWPNLSSDLIMTDRGDTGSYRNITASITVEGHSYYQMTTVRSPGLWRQPAGCVTLETGK